MHRNFISWSLLARRWRAKVEKLLLSDYSRLRSSQWICFSVAFAMFVTSATAEAGVLQSEMSKSWAASYKAAAAEQDSRRSIQLLGVLISNAQKNGINYPPAQYLRMRRLTYQARKDALDDAANQNDLDYANAIQSGILNAALLAPDLSDITNDERRTFIYERSLKLLRELSSTGSYTVPLALQSFIATNKGRIPLGGYSSLYFDYAPEALEAGSPLASSLAIIGKTPGPAISKLCKNLSIIGSIARFKDCRNVKLSQSKRLYQRTY